MAEDKSSYALLSMVAIVAIVGVVALLKGGPAPSAAAQPQFVESAAPVSMPAFDEGVSNIGGNAKWVKGKCFVTIRTASGRTVKIYLDPSFCAKKNNADGGA